MRLTKRSHKQSACCANSSRGNLVLCIMGGVLFSGVLLLNALVTLNLGPRKPATNDFTTETTSLRSSYVSSTLQVATENAVDIFKTFALNPPVPKDVPYPSAISDKTFFSQVGQDEAIDMVLQQKEHGFFIEVGAYDGISLSNSLFFEKSRSWTGLLIEANPRAYRELLAADRKAYTTPACISMSNKVELGVNFMAHGMVGGYANMDRYQKQNFQTDLQNNPYVYTVKANCFPLNTMLDAIGVNRVDMCKYGMNGWAHCLYFATTS